MTKTMQVDPATIPTAGSQETDPPESETLELPALDPLHTEARLLRLEGHLASMEKAHAREAKKAARERRILLAKLEQLQPLGPSKPRSRALDPSLENLSLIEALAAVGRLHLDRLEGIRKRAEEGIRNLDRILSRQTGKPTIESEEEAP